jgi:hypothetical protein
MIDCIANRGIDQIGPYEVCREIANRTRDSAAGARVFCPKCRVFGLKLLDESVRVSRDAPPAPNIGHWGDRQPNRNRDPSFEPR